MWRNSLPTTKSTEQTYQDVLKRVRSQFRQICPIWLSLSTRGQLSNRTSPVRGLWVWHVVSLTYRGPRGEATGARKVKVASECVGWGTSILPRSS